MIEPPEITSIHPTMAKMETEEIAIIQGTGFLYNREEKCKFGDLPPTHATRVNENTYACRIPKSEKPGKVTLKFSQNGVTFNSTKIQFKYYGNYLIN